VLGCDDLDRLCELTVDLANRVGWQRPVGNDAELLDGIDTGPFDRTQMIPTVTEVKLVDELIATVQGSKLQPPVVHDVGLFLAIPRIRRRDAPPIGQP
jgi:hypothetical protein